MRQRAARKPAGERRQQIIETAQDVFARAGYANTATADVAAAAGVAPAAIYRYFPSKRDLYLAALRDAGPRLLDLIGSTAIGTGDPLETIWRFGLAYYDRVNDRSAYARLWFQALGDASDEEVRQAIAENFKATVDLVSAQLDLAKHTGLVREDLEPRLGGWQFMAIGLMFDVLHHLQLDAELDRGKVETWGKMFIDSLRREP